MKGSQKLALKQKLVIVLAVKTTFQKTIVVITLKELVDELTCLHPNNIWVISNNGETALGSHHLFSATLQAKNGKKAAQDMQQVQS